MHEQHHHTREHRPHEHREHHGHHHVHHHHHMLYIRLMPHARRVWHAMGPHMDASHLDRMAEQVWHESGLAHDMPLGHTKESMHDFILILLLALSDGMMDDGNMPMTEALSPMHEPAAEAFNPLIFSPWWFGFPYYPFPFFPHRHPHFHRGRPGGRPGGGRPGGGHRPR